MKNTEIITYSEIFYSPQGEGMYTGEPTVWLRFFGCNLQCDGFGQKDPTDKTTYELPYKEFDPKRINVLEELPVFNKGCDSSYSWSKKYKHLMRTGTADEIANKLIDVVKSKFNPEGVLHPHPVSRDAIHLAFTGGEPMLYQKQIIKIVESLISKGPVYIPFYITIETNGTQELDKDFVNFFSQHSYIELMFSISPKLYYVSGEQPEKAIRKDVINQYTRLSNKAQLKFVMNTDIRAWNELSSVLNGIKFWHAELPVYIMPVGATDEGQAEVAGDVALMALERGYKVSGRLHINLFGNKLGT